MRQERSRAIGLIKGFLWIHLLAAALVELLSVLVMAAILLDDLFLLGDLDPKVSRVAQKATMTGLFMAGILVQVVLFIDTCRISLPAKRMSSAEIQIPRRTLWCGIGSMLLVLGSAGMYMLTYPNSPYSLEGHLLRFLKFLSAFVFIGCCFGLIHFGKRYPAFPGPL